MPYESPIHLGIKGEERKALELEICRRVTAAVQGAQQRDAYLQNWRDQLEGLGQASTNTRWKGACTYTDPITLEAFLTILSQITQALRRDPKVAVEAFVQEDEESAVSIEHYLVVEGNRVNVDARLYEAAHNACRDTAVPIYCGWQWKERPRRDVAYREPGTELIVSEESRDEDVHTEEVPLVETQTEEGYDIRVLDLKDFYVYPPNALSPSFEDATLCAERRRETDDTLIDGIEDFGYSKERVFDLLAAGPAQIGDNSDYEEQIDSQDGVEEATDRDGFYEIFTVFTRLPRRYGQDYLLPDHLRYDDFLCVCCPARNIVLKLDFSPFAERPYYCGNILPKTGRLQGYSVPSILEGPQAEANANIRCTIDSMNLTMVPACKVRKTAAADLNKWSIYPGAQIPLDDPVNDMVPLQWDRSPLRDGLAWAQDLRNRSQAVISAQGAGQLQQKVRKAGEIQAVEQSAGSKFGLYLWNFQRTVVGEMYRRMVSLKEQFGNVDAEEGEDYTFEGRAEKLTAKALRGKYKFNPTATSLTASPETRIEIAKQQQQVQAEYFGAITQLPPQYHGFIWHMARKLLLDLDEPNPESLIGPEPKAEQAQIQQPPQEGEGGAGAAVPQPPQVPQQGGGNFLQLTGGGA